MRSILRTLVVALLMFGASKNTFANTYPTIKLGEDKILVINLNEWKSSDLRVIIKELNGNVVHNERLVNKTSVKYNLKNVEIGNYELTIEDDMKKAVRQISVLENGLELRTYKTEIIFKPSVKTSGNYIDFNQLALGRDVAFTVSDRNEEFFTKIFLGESTINKRFDISNLPKGEYFATIKGNNQYDTYSFVK